MKRGMGILIGLLLVAPFLLPVPETLQRQLLFRSLGNQLHVILFVGLTLLLHARGPLRGRLLLAVAATVLIGGGVEVAQSLTQRHPRWVDFSLDLVGIGLAACWIRWRGQGSRPALGLGLLLLLVFPVRLHDLPWRLAAEREAGKRFPLLADFETSLERHLWEDTHGGRISFPYVDDRGHVLRLQGGPPDGYPGTELRGFPGDWSAQDRLEGLARAPAVAGDSLKICLRLADYHGRRAADWTVSRFWIGARWQKCEVDLKSLVTVTAGESLQLDDLVEFVIYVPVPTDTFTVELDDWRLVSAQPSR